MRLVEEIGLGLGGRRVQALDANPPPWKLAWKPKPPLENHLEERLLDQAQARTPYIPLFGGSIA